MRHPENFLFRNFFSFFFLNSYFIVRKVSCWREENDKCEFILHWHSYTAVAVIFFGEMFDIRCYFKETPLLSIMYEHEKFLVIWGIEKFKKQISIDWENSKNYSTSHENVIFIVRQNISAFSSKNKMLFTFKLSISQGMCEIGTFRGFNKYSGKHKSNKIK